MRKQDTAGGDATRQQQRQAVDASNDLSGSKFPLTYRLEVVPDGPVLTGTLLRCWAQLAALYGETLHDLRELATAYTLGEAVGMITRFATIGLLELTIDPRNGGEGTGSVFKLPGQFELAPSGRSLCRFCSEEPHAHFISGTLQNYRCNPDAIAAKLSFEFAEPRDRFALDVTEGDLDR